MEFSNFSSICPLPGVLGHILAVGSAVKGIVEEVGHTAEVTGALVAEENTLGLGKRTNKATYGRWF